MSSRMFRPARAATLAACLLFMCPLAQSQEQRQGSGQQCITQEQATTPEPREMMDQFRTFVQNEDNSAIWGMRHKLVSFAKSLGPEDNVIAAHICSEVGIAFVATEKLGHDHGLILAHDIPQDQVDRIDEGIPFLQACIPLFKGLKNRNAEKSSIDHHQDLMAESFHTFSQGVAYAATRHFASAVTCFKKVIAQTSEMKRILKKTGTPVPTTAVRQFQEWTARSAFSLGVVYKRLGKHKNALYWMERREALARRSHNATLGASRKLVDSQHIIVDQHKFLIRSNCTFMLENLYLRRDWKSIVSAGDELIHALNQSEAFFVFGPGDMGSAYFMLAIAYLHVSPYFFNTPKAIHLLETVCDRTRYHTFKHVNSAHRLDIAVVAVVVLRRGEHVQCSADRCSTVFCSLSPESPPLH